ncbi:MAG: site-2 protease family protein [Thermoplasmata archaeon]|nr:MAG: site-2 protease family protein [Thermoplasmata archaeon]
MNFTKEEIKELIISALVIGFVFAWVERARFYQMNFLEIFVVMLLAVGPAFIFHELAHKFVAQRRGCIAHYKMWETGLILAFFLAVSLKIIFAAPGAVYIRPIYFFNISRRDNGEIAAAGPLSNILLAIVFLALTHIGGILALVGSLGFMINSWLAFFNLLPFPPLDGSKVLAWDFRIWLALVLLSLGLMFIF